VKGASPNTRGTEKSGARGPRQGQSRGAGPTFFSWRETTSTPKRPLFPARAEENPPKTLNGIQRGRGTAPTKGRSSPVCGHGGLSLGPNTFSSQLKVPRIIRALKKPTILLMGGRVGEKPGKTRKIVHPPREKISTPPQRINKHPDGSSICRILAWFRPRKLKKAETLFFKNRQKGKNAMKFSASTAANSLLSQSAMGASPPPPYPGKARYRIVRGPLSSPAGNHGPPFGATIGSRGENSTEAHAAGTLSSVRRNRPGARGRPNPSARCFVCKIASARPERLTRLLMGHRQTTHRAIQQAAPGQKNLPLWTRIRDFRAPWDGFCPAFPPPETSFSVQPLDAR